MAFNAGYGGFAPTVDVVGGGLNGKGSALMGMLSPKAPDFGFKPVDFNGPLNPQLQEVHDQVSGMQAPSALQAYTARDMSKEALPEFDTMRNQTTQRLNAEKSGNSDSLERRMAAMGNLNSGAYVKASQMGEQAADQNMASAMNQIGAQEAQTRRGLQQQEDQRAFQSGESTKQFNANQSNHFNEFKVDANSKLAQLDLGFKSAQEQEAESSFNAAMQQFSAKHSGGLLGSGGFLGSGIGV